MAELRALKHRNLFLKMESSVWNFFTSVVMLTLIVVARLKFSVVNMIPW